jgi:hypothetical protein
MSEETTKLLNLMRFWVFGTFLIIAAAVIVAGFFIPGLFKEMFYWLGLIIAAVLCVVWYYAYKWWLGRKEAQG